MKQFDQFDSEITGMISKFGEPRDPPQSVTGRIYANVQASGFHIRVFRKFMGIVTKRSIRGAPMM
jgi:hypothetical protein